SDAGERIWVMNADGSNARQLVEPPANTEGGPVGVYTSVADDTPDWSPDGKDIVFHRLTSCQTCPTAKPDRLYVVHVATGHQRQLCCESGGNWNPAWSPDGKRIAFHGGTANSIHVVNADGSNVRTLTSGVEDADPAWSPDGKRITFGRLVADYEEDIY